MINQNEMKIVNEIEAKLENYKYNQIPKEFLDKLDEYFSAFSYLKSLIEMNREES